MQIENLKEIAEQNNINLTESQIIIEEAVNAIYERYNNDPNLIKENYDEIVSFGEDYAYKSYLHHEQEYGKRVISSFIDELIEDGEISGVDDVSQVLASYFKPFDRFYLSLSQSRRSRAGNTFEKIHNTLFQRLSYPFSYKQVINGEPDFVMPSVEHFFENPVDCIIFTSKRTLRERWRQIISEGARGAHFFLATIDDSISTNQLQEMRNNRVNIVCPQSIKDDKYQTEGNVFSFAQFFQDHLDPAVTRWTRNGIIE